MKIIDEYEARFERIEKEMQDLRTKPTNEISFGLYKVNDIYVPYIQQKIMGDLNISAQTAVGFTAYASTSRYFDAGEKIVFDSIISNVGNGYDATTSTFTCPTAGLYLISLVIYSANDLYLEAVLRQNGVVLGTAQAAKSAFLQSTNTFVTEADVGDTFDVACGFYYAGGWYDGSTFHATNTFSAVLISEYL